MPCSERTASFRSDSTSGRASPDGTGVTRPTRGDDSRCIRKGTQDENPRPQSLDVKVAARHPGIGEEVRTASDGQP
jgi:hypothetical protein